MATIVVVSLLAARDARASIIIQNADGPGEGLNDATATAPVGGNNATTLGAQRLAVLEYAASLMDQVISSPVDIIVQANFDPLPCGSSSVVYGSGGPWTYLTDFPHQARANTWYHSALADKLAGVDLDPGQPDLSVVLNSSVGTTCAFPLDFYYGLDADPTLATVDVVTVALAELGQGLGFATSVDLATGAKSGGRDDAFMLFLEDHSTGKRYPDMTDAERVAASKNTGNLHWVGSAVVSNSGSLSAGRDPSGHVRMYAPDPQEPGSSVSHWDESLSPNQLMEPVYVGPIHDVGLLRYVFEDIGWFIELPTSTTTTTTLAQGAGCGDPSGDDSITATDALSELRVAVGALSCALCVCDVNGSSEITASDALLVLRKAVGIDVLFSCPAC